MGCRTLGSWPEEWADMSSAHLVAARGALGVPWSPEWPERSRTTSTVPPLPSRRLWPGPAGLASRALLPGPWPPRWAERSDRLRVTDGKFPFPPQVKVTHCKGPHEAHVLPALISVSVPGVAARLCPPSHCRPRPPRGRLHPGQGAHTAGLAEL